MTRLKGVTTYARGASASHPQPEIDGVELLDDPARFYLARRAIETGQGTPLEVARLLGLDAATLCALLGIQVDA